MAKLTLPKQVTDQLTSNEIDILVRELVETLDRDIEGDVVEFGCYEGGSAVIFQYILQKYGYPKTLWLYDSFEGLPEKTQEDTCELGGQFVAGALKASKARLEKHFFKAGLHKPEIYRAWFFELDDSDVPRTISFAFLDGDYYESIRDSLSLVWAKMSVGSVIAIDDYTNPALPGVKKAVDEWLIEFPDRKLIVEKSLAIIKM